MDAAFHLKTECLNLIPGPCREMMCQYICSLSMSDLVMCTFLFFLLELNWDVMLLPFPIEGWKRLNKGVREGG